jgi:hypothetical protein
VRQKLWPQIERFGDVDGKQMMGYGVGVMPNTLVLHYSFLPLSDGN